MSMIKIENLTFSYPGSYDPVFEQINFQIDTDWKLGLIGRNGRGKTTFLKLLQKKYEYSGTIVSSVSFDYFPYPVNDPAQWTQEVLQEVCPQAEEWELLREFSYLEVDPDVLWRPFQTLSNGEQTKVLLAALFLNPGRFLLIDEPTNHLDRAARELVSQYLRRKKGFVLVSHDRHFLDGCVDHILSLNRTSIEVQSGNFSSWMENFTRQQEFEQTQHDRLQGEVKRLQQAARRAASWSDRTEASKIGTGAYDRGFIGHKAAKMMKRSKAVEARREQAAEEKAKLLKNVETAEELKLFPLSDYRDRLITFSDVVVRYGERDVCGPVSFTLRRGERVVLEGKNGSGKSSLLKLLLGQPVPHTGEVTTASGLVISYVPQNTGHLRGSLADFAAEHDLDESLFKTILRKMDFERVQFEKNLEDLSSGQKKKVLLARSLCERAHVYVWDEPLNFIDIYSRMQVEQLLCRFAPAMLFVEHDRVFQETVATNVLSLTKKTAELF